MARKATVLALLIGIVTLCSWSTPVATGPSAAMTPDEFVRSWNERSAGDQIPLLKCDDRTTVTAQAGRLALRPTCDGTGAIVTLELQVPSDASQALVQRAVDALYSGRAPQTISAKLLSEGKSDGGNTEVSLLEFQDDAAERTVTLKVSPTLSPPATTTSTIVSTTTSSAPSSTTFPPPTTTDGGGGGFDPVKWAKTVWGLPWWARVLALPITAIFLLFAVVFFLMGLAQKFEDRVSGTSKLGARLKTWRERMRRKSPRVTRRPGTTAGG